MLSIEDFYKEIGKNIYIYPLKDLRILGNSVDLTASKFAWTADDGKYIFDEAKNEIIVPPHKTACILTQEVVYVTDKIGGTYHSRVSLAKRGFGHMGTMLDPEYIGQTLVILHNTTDKEQKIAYKERIISIVFYYLHTPILTQSHNASPGHIDKLATYEHIDKYASWCEQNRWAREKRVFVDMFLSSDDYKDLKNRREIDQKTWNTRFKNILNYFKEHSRKYTILAVLCIIIYFISNCILLNMNVSDKANLIGVMVGVILGVMVGDLEKRTK